MSIATVQSFYFFLSPFTSVYFILISQRATLTTFTHVMRLILLSLQIIGSMNHISPFNQAIKTTGKKGNFLLQSTLCQINSIRCWGNGQTLERYSLQAYNVMKLICRKFLGKSFILSELKPIRRSPFMVQGLLLMNHVIL